MAEIDFTALICSRLCHDLISPVGALNNGVEILNDEHDSKMREQVLELLQVSARQTSNKLQFFRLAFGASAGFKEQMNLHDAHKGLAGFLEGGKVELAWKVGLDQAQKRAVKLLLNVCLVAAEGLIHGGLLSVTMEERRGRYTIDISAKGSRFLMAKDLVEALTKRVDDAVLTPRTAPAQMAYRIGDVQNGTIKVKHDDKGARILVTLEVAPS